MSANIATLHYDALTVLNESIEGLPAEQQVEVIEATIDELCKKAEALDESFVERNETSWQRASSGRLLDLSKAAPPHTEE
jgi:hypothetical protein